MGDFYHNRGSAGFTTSRTMFTASGNIGGRRSVFYEDGGYKNHLHMPTFGGTWKNPFKGDAKFYAGDLWYIKTDDKCEKPEVYLLKTYKVKSMSSTEVKIYRDGYSHIPFVGDVLMKAPAEIGGEGKGYTIQSVVEDEDGGTPVWKVVFNTEIDSCLDGDILVEAESENATATMLVKTINGVAPNDNDFFYAPYSPTSSQKMDKTYVTYAPVMGGIMYKHKMSPIPACVEALNKSRINGLYEV